MPLVLCWETLGNWHFLFKSYSQIKKQKYTTVCEDPLYFPSIQIINSIYKKLQDKIAPSYEARHTDAKPHIPDSNGLQNEGTVR